MVKGFCKIRNETGLQLEAAGAFCDEAMKYSSEIHFQKGTYSGNAKSIISVIGGCVARDETIEIICEGADEEEALEGIKKAVEAGLGE